MITKKCIWYNNTEKDISKLLPIFTIKKNNFDTKFFNNIEHSKSNYHNQNNFYVNKNYIDYDIDINKLINKKDESLLRNSIKKEIPLKKKVQLVKIIIILLKLKCLKYIQIKNNKKLYLDGCMNV